MELTVDMMQHHQEALAARALEVEGLDVDGVEEESACAAGSLEPLYGDGDRGFRDGYGGDTAEGDNPEVRVGCRVGLFGKRATVESYGEDCICGEYPATVTLLIDSQGADTAFCWTALKKNGLYGTELFPESTLGLLPL